MSYCFLVVPFPIQIHKSTPHSPERSSGIPSHGALPHQVHAPCLVLRWLRHFDFRNPVLLCTLGVVHTYVGPAGQVQTSVHLCLTSVIHRIVDSTHLHKNSNLWRKDPHLKHPTPASHQSAWRASTGPNAWDQAAMSSTARPLYAELSEHLRPDKIWVCKLWHTVYACMHACMHACMDGWMYVYDIDYCITPLNQWIYFLKAGNHTSVDCDCHLVNKCVWCTHYVEKATSLHPLFPSII